MLSDPNFLIAFHYRKWIAYGFLSLPLFVLAFIGQPSVLGIVVTGLYSAWFVTGIFGGAGEDVPEGEAEFGIPFILLGLLVYGAAFAMAMGAAGTASDAIAIGLLVLLGALIVLGVAPGIDASGDLQVGGLVMLGALMPALFGMGHDSPLLIYMGLLFSGSVVAAARLATLTGRGVLYLLLVGYVGLVVWVL